MEISKEDAKKFIALALQESFLQDICKSYMNKQLKFDEYEETHKTLDDLLLTFDVPEINAFLYAQISACNNSMKEMLHKYYIPESKNKIAAFAGGLTPYITDFILSIKEQYDPEEETNDGN
jgi:hypothetical protein